MVRKRPVAGRQHTNMTKAYQKAVKAYEYADFWCRFELTRNPSLQAQSGKPEFAMREREIKAKFFDFFAVFQARFAEKRTLSIILWLDRGIGVGLPMYTRDLFTNLCQGNDLKSKGRGKSTDRRCRPRTFSFRSINTSFVI